MYQQSRTPLVLSIYSRPKHVAVNELINPVLCMTVLIQILATVIFTVLVFIISSRVMAWSKRGYITGENDTMGFKIFNSRLILLGADPSDRAV
jgi:hypothetical protein